MYASDKGWENPFPLPFCMLFAGYCLVLLVDKVIMHKIIESRLGHGMHGGGHSTVKPGEAEMASK